MNVRPADSNALAATDFFAATSQCQPMGPIPFERLLRTATPPPLERPPPRQEGNRISSCPPPPPPTNANASEAQPVHDEQTHAPTQQQTVQEPAKGSADANDDSHPATDISGHGPPRGEEASDSQQDVAAESLLAASTAQAPPVIEQPVKLPAGDSTLTVVTDSDGKETDDATPATLAELRDQRNAELAANSVAVTTQPAAAEQGVPCAVTISPPASGETAADVPEVKGLENAELPAHGIGVLPSALLPSHRPATKPASTSSPRNSSQRIADATSEGDGENEQPAEASAADVPNLRDTKESSRGNESLLAAFRTNETGPQTAQQSPLNQPLPSDAPIDVGPVATAEPPTANNSSRSDLTESRLASSAPANAPPTAAASTTGIAQRLPNHVLVRSNNNPATATGFLQIDTVRFIQRVARAFDSARELGTDVRLRLSPPELGALRVEVNMAEHGLVARVEAETPEARTILLENLPALRERLAEQGVKLERFDVDLSQHRSNQDQHHQPNQPQDRQAPPQPRTPRPATNAQINAPNRPTNPSPTNHDRRLNVIV